MASGVHTSRIVRNTARIAESFGFEAHMTLFHKTIIMTLRNKENTHVYSMVNTAKAGAINFEINSDLSALSWEAYDNHLPLDQLWGKISCHYKQTSIKCMAGMGISGIRLMHLSAGYSVETGSPLQRFLLRLLSDFVSNKY